MNGKTIFKRALALALVLVLLCAQFPAAYAEDELELYYQLENITVEAWSEYIKKPNSEATITLEAKTGYSLPTSINDITVDGVGAEKITYNPLPDGSRYSLRIQTGSGPSLTIAAAGVRNKYTVATTGTNVFVVDGIDTDNKAYYADDVAFTVSGKPTGYEDYYSPSVTVTKAGGGTVDCVWDGDETFTFTMPADNVTISAAWVLNDAPFTVSDGDGNELTGVTIVGSGVWYKGASAVITPLPPATGVADTETSEAAATLTVDLTSSSFWLTDGTSRVLKIIKLDNTVPTVTIKYDGSALASGENVLPAGKTFTIDASDSDSGLDTVRYLIKSASEFNYTDNVARYNALEAMNGWNDYPVGGITGTSGSADQILLVKATDKVGNYSYFWSNPFLLLSSEGGSAALQVTGGDDMRAVTSGGSTTYYLRGTGTQYLNLQYSPDSSVTYSDFSKSKPGNAEVTVNGEVVTSSSTAYAVNADWTQDATNKVWNRPISLHLGNLADGTYTVGAKAWGNLGGEYSAANVKFVLHRTAPMVELSYTGMVGYDDGGSYTPGNSASDSDTTHADSFTSTKTLYTNGTAVTVAVTIEQDYLIYLGETPFIIELDGEAVTNTGGTSIDEIGKKIVYTVPATIASGEHTLVFNISGFNGQTKTVTAAKIVVDRSGIAAGEITAKGPGENDPIVENGAWTNQNELVLTLAGIQSVSGLASVSFAEDETVADSVFTKPADSDTWTWTGTVSGEQNHTYTVTLTDKAGNEIEKTFTVMIDATLPDAANAKVYARKSSTDMALIADQFTFGVFHVDYDRLSTKVEDAETESTGVYDPNEDETPGDRISDIDKVQYYFAPSGSAAFTYFLEHDVVVDGETVQRPYTFAELKGSADAQSAVNAKIAAKLPDFLADSFMEDENEGWRDCTLDANTGTWVTGVVNKNLQYVAFFRVYDKAGNMTGYYRSVIITDSIVPEVSIALKTDGGGNVLAPSITTAAGAVIYTGAVPLTVTVSEPNQTEGYYAGLALVTYTVYCGGQVFGTADTLLYDSELGVPKEGESTAATDKELNEQGEASKTFPITLDDAAGAKLEGKDVCVAVTVRDIAGKSDTYYSNAQIGYLNIDKSAPVVTVDFAPASTAYASDLYSAGRTYYATPTAPGRKATITVEDANFDPTVVDDDETTADCLSLTDGTTISLSDITWTAAEPDAYGKVKHTGVVYFDEGEHCFGINVLDLVAVTTADDTLKTAHSTLDDAITYNSTDQKNFEMDWTDPSLSANFTRVDGKAYTDYNNSAVSMTATCSEKNFDEGNVDLTVTLNGGVTPIGFGMSGSKGSYSGTCYFTEEGSYTVDLAVTDLAGRSDRIDTETFVIDITKPVIEITGVEDQHAYNGETIVPVVRVTDAYYDELGVKITLTGANGGKGYFDEAYIAGGQSFTFENIEDDDLYTLVVVAEDLAGNISEKTVHFSVNRNGSVFTPGGEIGEAMDKGLPYFRSDTLPPVRVVETNVDIVESAKLYLTKDNTNIDLVEGRDYTITRTEVNGGWSQYTYEINKDVFVEDGVYRVSLVTKDKAGNAKNAESVVAFILDNTPPLLIVSDLRSGAIYNEETKHVTFMPSDNLLLSKVEVVLNGEVIAVWEGEELAEMLRSNAEFGFDIPESNSRQDAQIILTDAAGNENENQLFEKFLVSTNLFVRFYNNKPVFYGTIIGVAVLAGSVAAFLSRRKRASAAAAAVEE